MFHICDMKMGTKRMFPAGMGWIHLSHSLTTQKSQSQSETPAVRFRYLWPLTRWTACCWHKPAGGDRLRFMSRHDSNTIRRSGQAVRLSEGGRAERGVEAGEPAEARETQQDRRTWRGYGQGNTRVATHSLTRTHTNPLTTHTSTHNVASNHSPSNNKNIIPQNCKTSNKLF